MILPFSTQMNGKPSYFVEKIWSGLIDKKIATIDDCRQFEKHHEGISPIPFEICPYYKPKLHTLREDKKDRWQEGKMIDFFINCRQKDMFRFAPVLPVVSVQNVEIFYSAQSMWNDTIARPTVYVDGYDLHPDKIRQLAQNDGFDTIEDFFTYFNEDFKGKIIHWTDLKY